MEKLTQREALEALLDGKTLETDHKGDLIRLYSGNLEYRYGRPSDWRPCIFVRDCHLYVNPNPHPSGTWSWAREEARRGHVVLVTLQGAYSLDENRYDPVWFERVSFTVQEITATTWKHAR